MKGHSGRAEAVRKWRRDDAVNQVYREGFVSLRTKLFCFEESALVLHRKVRSIGRWGCIVYPMVSVVRNAPGCSIVQCSRLHHQQRGA